MRVRRGRPVRLARRFDDEEAPVEVSGVRVAVYEGEATGRPVVELPAEETAPGVWEAVYTFPRLDHYALVWTYPGGAERSAVEVIESPLVTVAEIRASDPMYGDRTKYPTGLLSEVRDGVEAESERITGRAFTRRGLRGTERVTGSPWLLLPVYDVRQVVSVEVDGVPVPVGSVEASPSGVLSFTDAPPAGSRVAYSVEYGFDHPPEDVRRAVLLRIRDVLIQRRSGIPDRATSFTAEGGGTFALATPGRGVWETGLPEVDAVLNRYKLTLLDALRGMVV